LFSGTKWIEFPGKKNATSHHHVLNILHPAIRSRQAFFSGYSSTLATQHSTSYACRHRPGQHHKRFSGSRQSARCVLEPELLPEKFRW
jgi:hypothetical protein